VDQQGGGGGGLVGIERARDRKIDTTHERDQDVGHPAVDPPVVDGEEDGL